MRNRIRTALQTARWSIGDNLAWALGSADLAHTRGRPVSESGRFLAAFSIYLVVAGAYGYIVGVVPGGVERANLLLRLVSDDALGYFLVTAGLAGLVGAYSTRPGALHGGYIVTIGAAGAMWLWFVFGLAMELVGPNPVELRAVASAAVWGMLAYAVGKVQKLLVCS